MNFRIKQVLLAAGIASTVVLPMTSQASDGTITFTGAVTASTCTVSVGGNSTSNSGGLSGDGTVSLPTVSVSSLPNAATKSAPSTAAGTFFNMTVTGCSTVADIGSGPSAPTTVEIYFEAGPNVDVKTSGLINTVSGSNVEVNLYNASGSTIVGTQIKPGVQGSTGNQPTAIAITSVTGAGTVTQSFYAGYSTAALASGTAATAGAVNTSVNYSLIYD